MATLGSAGRLGWSGATACPKGRCPLWCSSQMRCESAAFSSGFTVRSTRQAHSARVSGSCITCAAAACAAGPCSKRRMDEHRRSDWLLVIRSNGRVQESSSD